MEWTISEILEQEVFFRRNLINSVTGFKSVALIGSSDQNGVTNLCPVSQVIHVGANPPLIGILFRPHTVVRNTLENILSQKCFTLNHIKSSFVKEAHHTSARWEGSEFEHCKLNEEYVSSFKAPFVQEASIKMGLELVERIDIQTNGTHFIVGKILHLIVPDEVILPDGFVDLEKAGTLTCSGLDSYHETKKIARFEYARANRELKEL